MKKIMIAAAVICMAVASQAASVKWQTYATGTSGALYNGSADATAYATYGAVTAYLIDTATYTQADAFADLVAGTFNASKTIESATLSTASKIAQKQVEYGEVGVNNTLYWVAILDSENFYISSTKTDSPLSTGGKQITWSDVKSTSQTTLSASDGFTGAAGFYNTAAIPEPTSALMLLVGLAGLALRRKQA